MPLNEQLNADEASFFETGELPPALADAPAPEPAPAPKIDAPAEPAPAPELTALETFMAEERQHRIALESRFEEAMNRLASQTAPKPEPVELPNEMEDPLGHMISRLASIDSRLTTTEQQTAARDQLTQFTAAVQSQKAEFEKSTPDFQAAYTHIRALRTEDLRAAGVPESNISQTLVQDELQLALTAMQRGKNPAAEMYAMAKRYGYNATAAKAAPSDKVVTPEQKMAQLKAGAKVSINPPKAGSDVDLNFDNLKDASNSDLDKLVQDNKLWDSVIGGTNGSDIFGGR